jgi:hypothetical protein
MTLRNDLVSTWINFHLHKREEDFWAFQELDLLVHSSPRNAWTVIRQIFDSSQSEHVRSNLAAGPIEDLLCRHGNSFINEVETLSRQNPSFGKMIKSVWSGGMSPDIQAKVKDIQTKYGNAV